MAAEAPTRPHSTLLTLVLLWLAFYCSFTLFTPPLLDDADSVHVEVAREMLLHHDFVTLYANGIRYLEKAPLLYWSMAGSMKLFMLFGASSPRTLAAAARIPLALSVLALVLVCEAFARRLSHSAHAGLYTGLILLSSFGIFIFTRITIPDALVCLWIAVSLYCFWRTEELEDTPENPGHRAALRWWSWGFAASCALNVLSKGLIGIVFPVGIILIYLAITRGFRRGARRLRNLHLASALLVFLAIAAPWHILAGLANPTVGHPTPFRFVHGHWIVPLPNDGNVRGWFWFYFMNEHVLRYLNLRVPHDYDTDPLWLFWGLCLVWLMPWSAFVFKAAGSAMPWRNKRWRSQIRHHDLPLKRRGQLLLIIWAMLPLLFFSLSTRQEYYVLPALPAAAVLIAGWLSLERESGRVSTWRSPGIRTTAVLLTLGTIFAATAVFFLLHTHAPTTHTDLATLLSEHPGDYALSMGHFLDLNADALGLFRLPLTVAAIGLFCGPLAALLLRSKARPHAANLALAAGAFMFLLAADLGLRIFSPVLTSAPLAEAIAPQVRVQDMVAIHGEYETGSTLGFYLKRNNIHILEGRSSNLWYGSFFPDAPHIFETSESFAAKWHGSQRIFLWQSLTDPPNRLPSGLSPVYVLARSGGKEIVSNQSGK